MSQRALPGSKGLEGGEAVAGECLEPGGGGLVGQFEVQGALHVGRAFATLWAGVASPGQAGRLLREQLLNPEKYHTPWRVPVLAASEPGYSPDPLPDDIGCTWRANVWAPINYYIRDGLMLYGFEAEARELSRHSERLVQTTGLREYFRSTDGKGCGLDPFWGWTSLLLFMPAEDKAAFHPSLALFKEIPAQGWESITNRAAVAP